MLLPSLVLIKTICKYITFPNFQIILKIFQTKLFFNGTTLSQKNIYPVPVFFTLSFLSHPMYKGNTTRNLNIFSFASSKKFFS